MKRLIIPFAFLCFLFMACPPLPHHYMYGYEIEYVSIGRADSEYILLKEGTIKYVQNNQDTLSNSLRKRDYKALYNFLNGFKLDSLEVIQVPSKKYLYDGALATTLTVTDLNPKQYKSPTFDHDNPPEKIKGFIEYIKKISKR